MKLALKARMPDGTFGIAFFEGPANWIPMNSGDRINPEELPIQFLGIEMQSSNGMATAEAAIPTVRYRWDGQAY